MRLPRFPPQVYVLLLGRFVNDLGRGFTFPFNALYFNTKVGLSMKTVGLGITLFALMGAVAVFAGGYVSDKFGRKRSLLISMLGSAVVYGLYPWIQSAGAYLAASALAGAFLSLYWPSSNAMLTDLTPPQERARAFAWLRVVINAALGLGALGGSWTLTVMLRVSADPVRPYHILYWIDAGTYLAFFLIVLFFLRETLPQDGGESYGGFRAGWGEALRDRRLWALAALMTCFTLMFSVYHFLPVYLEKYAGLGPGRIGWVLAWNTALVVVLQMPYWSIFESWRRTRALAVAAAFFAAGLLGFVFCEGRPDAALWIALGAITLYTLGELGFGPAGDALFGALAPAHLRGTYMSVQSLAWGLGMGLGPSLAGPFLDGNRPRLLWAAMMVIIGIGAVGMLLFERTMPQGMNGAPAPGREEALTAW